MADPLMLVKGNSKHISFMCGNCNSPARLEALSSLRETTAPHLDDRYALKIKVNCLICNQFQFFILQLADV